MASFPIGIRILQALQVINKLPSRIPCLSGGVDRRANSPVGGGIDAVAA
jgi:hypothetical protein